MEKDTERIEIFPYNPEWKSFFINEKKLLRLHLKGEYKSIIHIGSTSIEGMDAKSIIDISIAVNELKDTIFYEEKFLPSGYKLCNGSKFEKWILFNKDDCGQKYHVHLMHYDSMRLFKQVMFKIFMEGNSDAADLYIRKKKAYLILDDHIWYSMNKKPFVDEINMYALLDAIEKPNYWKKRIEDIMGYVPHAELFTIEKRGIKQVQFKIAYKLLQDERPINEILKITDLSRKEMDYLL
jgi:GrpB-like predicted nucleotidyltransferase (UPF0157 family)